MPEVIVRKTVISVEEIYHERGPVLDQPHRRDYIASVIQNQFADRYVEDIVSFIDDLKPLGLSMAKQLIEALGGDAGVVEAYGKASVVGEDGELEHAALWHAPGGYSMREPMPHTKASILSAPTVDGHG